MIVEVGDRIIICKNWPLKWWQRALKWVTRGRLYPDGWPIEEHRILSIESKYIDMGQ